MARKYQAIWKEIKKHGHCSIAVHPLMVARIKKAVIKEKDADIGYKLMLNSRGMYAKMGIQVTGARIRFFLTEHIAGKITLEDL
jgi:hypothetical protein